VRTRSPVYVPNVAEDSEYRRYLGEEMKSELAVPLIIGEEVIGVLNMESPVPGFYTLYDARILQSFAGQAAVAIDRAKKFEIQTLAEIGGVSGDIVHRLNNPVGAISMRLELLKGRGEYREMISKYPYLAKFIEIVEGNTFNAKTIIQELRTAIKGKAPGPTDLQPAITKALSMAYLPENIRVEQSLPDSMVRVTANDRLVNIFWNLFDNARKAMPHGGHLTITASISADAQWVTVEVRDTGQGVEPWRLPLIFEAGETTTKDPNAPGHGLGLWWVKAQLENFGGEITVGSELGVGTWVTLKLKKAA
jgi:signal transduction histidine kinase